MRRKYRKDPIETARERLSAVDSEVIESLVNEGYSYQEAVQIAVTEMWGVREIDGEVWGTQTYCDVLHPQGFERRFGRFQERE